MNLSLESNLTLLRFSNQKSEHNKDCLITSEECWEPWKKDFLTAAIAALLRGLNESELLHSIRKGPHSIWQ